VNIPRFIDLAKESIPNFCGLKYTSGDLEQGIACLKSNVQIFLGADTILCAALAAGFDSAIMTSLNICPEYSNNIVRAMNSGKISEAQGQQKELNGKIKNILKAGKKKI
jgi:N-acetylneuraminate lyase